MATSTPWGKAYSKTRIAVGIMSYSTESHGGYHLSPKRQAQLIPEASIRNWNGSAEWFEEDADWAVVFLSFPTEFKAHMPQDEYEYTQDCAIATAKNYHPEFYTAYVAQRIGTYPMTTVLNLSTGSKFIYSVPPEQAVVCAYAQYELCDWNTWDYAKKYNHLITRGAHSVSCGDYTALLDQRIGT